MDQVRIGRFIADERKKKGWTQKQLAEKLNISDKTVSKWECGNGFPEVSLLLPLCDELGINVNDLLSGEVVSGEDYQKKAENNMVEMIQEKETNRKQFRLTLTLGAVSLVSFVTLLIVVCLYTDVIPLPVKAVLIAVACTVFAAGILAAVMVFLLFGALQNSDNITLLDQATFFVVNARLDILRTILYLLKNFWI